ncbi:NAD(P)-dependent oxidoreductase [Photorhabdus sp. APURE]|uniref:NAD-dependent epimerase/dehydratase family protein n=1 Tax=Photorhabdus aballayi TaxID=2991723 RepID=UPI00223D4076|nr:NAD(P)-dependent oxidoreductase [Photorhabdus aballayi]MCW7548259.1 NAD(P)-dependent oxidoreductase [Photorhabdus aballayi]
MTRKIKTAIVTGATGFIGRHLVHRLLQEQFSVIAISRSKTPCHVVINNDIRVIWCQWHSVENCITDQHNLVAVIHLATAYGRTIDCFHEIEKANVLKPLTLLEFSVKHKIPIFINTDSFFTKTEYNYQHMIPYILTKRSFNKWGEYFSSLGELSFINMRLEHVYGPGDREGKFIPFLINALKSSTKKIDCTDCSQKRDFIYIDDVIDAYITVLKYGTLPGYVEYGVGLGYSVTMKDFIECLKKQLISNISIDYGALPHRKNEIMNSYADNSSLVVLGWKPKTNYLEGINNMIKKS